MIVVNEFKIIGKCVGSGYKKDTEFGDVEWVDIEPITLDMEKAITIYLGDIKLSDCEKYFNSSKVLVIEGKIKPLDNSDYSIPFADKLTVIH